MEVKFPKWFYHADQGAVLVKSKEQFDAMGSGWANSPDEAKAMKGGSKKSEAVESPGAQQMEMEPADEAKAEVKPEPKPAIRIRRGRA